MFRHFAAEFHWTPPTVMDGMTAGQLWAFLRPANRTPHDPATVRARVNQIRLKKGLPPLPSPRPRR